MEKENKNVDTKPNANKKEAKMQNFYKGFFKKLYYSIVKIERYPEMAAEGFPKAISYFAKLVAIFAIISCLGTIYNLNIALKDATEYLQSSFPDFSYKDGVLNVQSEEPIIIEENEQLGKIIIDTKDITKEQETQYTNQINEVGDGVVVLKDKIIVKTQATLGTANYNFSELFNQLGLTEFNKQNVIDFINSSQIISLYISVFVMIFIYVFVIYFLNLLTYVIFVSLFGCIANLMTKLRMRYVAVFNMAVYSVTLSTILYMIYLGVNIFIPFEIKYFEPMYISIATIYLVAAILILKSEAIKKQIEIMKLQEIQNQVRSEMQEKEREDREKEERQKEDAKKEKEQKKNEKEDEKNKQRENEQGEQGVLNITENKENENL